MPFSSFFKSSALIEYLSPEFIFNAGHDQSADLWALGVMIYEMYMGVTPFAPRQAGNMTDLFTRIATVKVCNTLTQYGVCVKICFITFFIT
jgi:serine/threonine protein kinase